MGQMEYQFRYISIHIHISRMYSDTRLSLFQRKECFLLASMSAQNLTRLYLQQYLCQYKQIYSHISTVIKIKEVQLDILTYLYCYKNQRYFFGTLVRHQCMSWFQVYSLFGNTYPYLSCLLSLFAFENTKSHIRNLFKKTRMLT